VDGKIPPDPPTSLSSPFVVASEKTNTYSNISLSLELNDTMPKLGLILLIKEMKAKRG
jgi:hypothetical protein